MLRRMSMLRVGRLLPLLLVCSAACTHGTGTSTTVAGAPTAAPQVSSGPSTLAAAPSPNEGEGGNIGASASPCRTDRLAITLGRAGAAAGTAYKQVLFQNRGRNVCTLRGYPGISFLDRRGRQVGMSATDEAGVRVETVTLTPQGYADSEFGVSSPVDYQTPTSTCRPAATAYVRIYPPGQRTAVTISYDTEVCTVKARPLVTPVTASTGNGSASG